MDERDEQNKLLRTLNFDTVTCGYVDITKDGTTYHLRDDVPSAVMLRLFVASSLQSIQARLAERFEAEAKRIAALSPEDAAKENGRRVAREAMQDEVRQGQRETFDILGEIIRHTPDYRAVTTEQLSGRYDAAHWTWEDGLFSLDEAEQICRLFFQLRSLASLQQQSAPPSSPAHPGQRPASRAERRAQARARMRAGQGSNLGETPIH
jgi:hypothetical protein